MYFLSLTFSPSPLMTMVFLEEELVRLVSRVQTWLFSDLNIQECYVLLIFVTEAWTTLSSVTHIIKVHQKMRGWYEKSLRVQDQPWDPLAPWPVKIMCDVILEFLHFLSMGVEDWKMSSNTSKSIFMFIKHHHHLLPLIWYIQFAACWFSPAVYLWQTHSNYSNE